MKVISVRETPEYRDKAIAYLQKSWSEAPPVLYADCISHCIDAPQALPQWYLLEHNAEIIGCAGLVTNDFNSRMDLYPWLCALFIDERHRGNAYGSLLIEKAKTDTRKGGFSSLYLYTNLIGFYERYGFEYIGNGYDVSGEEIRIYKTEVNLVVSD